jgi:hypothetical protein
MKTGFVQAAMTADPLPNGWLLMSLQLWCQREPQQALRLSRCHPQPHPNLSQSSCTDSDRGPAFRPSTRVQNIHDIDVIITLRDVVQWPVSGGSVETR